MRQSYVEINNVPTKIVTWGKCIDEKFSDNERKDIVICIPGNPGVTDFYKSFLQTIHEEIGYPVWIIGHSGHERPPASMLKSDTKSRGDGYSLKSQITHKVEFISRYVPDDVRIHFVGHSVGCYTILHLLKIPWIKSKTVKSYFLFPTIEHLGESFNMMFMTKIIQPIVLIIIFLSWIFTMFPYFIQKLLITIYCKIERVDKRQIEPIRKFVDPFVLGNVFRMAFDQRDVVIDRDNETLTENKNRIKLYYGAHDNWAPKRFFYSLKTEIPDIDADVCTRGFTHAFVLRQSEEVGKMVASWLKDT